MRFQVVGSVVDN